MAVTWNYFSGVATSTRRVTKALSLALTASPLFLHILLLISFSSVISGGQTTPVCCSPPLPFYNQFLLDFAKPIYFHYSDKASHTPIVMLSLISASMLSQNLKRILELI